MSLTVTYLACLPMQEHRGFAFVSYETEAAIQRVVSHGSHRLKGSTIAIDIAMPKVSWGG
jgi:RNA-binding protein Musashi